MIKRLIEIASNIEAKSLVSQLNDIKDKMERPNPDVILPLVGEFSAGKTTLVNSLTDSKELETSAKPTTATIFEIHFGQNACNATVIKSDGSSVDVADISRLKNSELADAKIVIVNDTSTKVPQSITLVDTPGLASPDPKHKQALTEFLPFADAVLLVVDINKQITRALTDFIQTSNLANRPVYLVITQCGYKSSVEVEQSRNKVAKECKLPLEQIACIDAKDGNISELTQIFNSIQNDKKKILEAVNGQRLKNIAQELDTRIADMLKKAKSDKEISEALEDVKDELVIIKRNIANLMSDMKDEVEGIARQTVRRFEDVIFPKLDFIASQKGVNFDGEVVASVNGTACLMMNEFESQVAKVLSVNCNKRVGTENQINLQSLAQIDLSNLQIGTIGANLGLNTMGHEYDETIGKVVLVGAALACLPAAAGAIGGGAAATGAAGAIGAAEAAGATATAVSTIDAVTDVASIAYTAHSVSKISKLHEMQQRFQQGMETAKQLDQQFGEQVGQKGGIIASAVGFFTEFAAKPQRQRAVRNYISSQLIPEFSSRLNQVQKNLLSVIEQNVTAEAQSVIDEKTNALNSLKSQFQQEKSAFENRKKELQSFRNELKNI